MHDLNHNVKIFYVYRVGIVICFKLSSIIFISYYLCNVGVSLVLPIIVFSFTSYIQDLWFYLIQTTESFTNLTILDITAISCHITHLKLASLYKVYGMNFLSTTASKFIPQLSRATCQIYKHRPVKLKKKHKNNLILGTVFGIYNHKDYLVC